MEKLTAFVRAESGLDFDRDRGAIAQLAAIGLTIQAWRNTSLEDLHSGSHPSGGFPDPEMMRFSIATFRVVSEHVQAERFDWSGLHTALTDPNRELPGGLTVGALCGDEFENLSSDIHEALDMSEWIQRKRGFPYLLMFLALRGISYKGWYGTPWWGDVVELFIELLVDPTSSAWRRDEHHEAEPHAVSDRATLSQILLEAPESLDNESIDWCLVHGLASQATFGGFARWRRRRDPDWIDPLPRLSEG
jgi:hypothetical protein